MTKSLPPIAAQLNHRDAFFYDVQVEINHSAFSLFDLSTTGNNIYGLFEGIEPAQVFSFPIADFLAAARDNGVIDEYREDCSSVWLDDSADGSTVPTLEWLAQFLADGDKFLQAVLATCAKDQIDRRISTARATLARMVNRKSFTYDDLPEHTEAVHWMRELIELFETHPQIVTA